MSRPKKRTCWLYHFLYGEYEIADGRGRYIKSFCSRGRWGWHSLAAPNGSPLHLKRGYKIKISITPTKSGFSVRATGKPEKI